MQESQYLRSIQLHKEKIDSYDRYPFSLPVIKNISNLEFHPKVTFIVGENGTGKSTILEAIAVAYGFNPEGGTKNFNFVSRASHSKLYDYIRLVKGIKKPADGFFLRAESFYNLATTIEELDNGIGGPRVIDSYGGYSLHEQSHGESFFAVFMNRFRGNGLYILDEPEAALSPLRQMSMISRIHQLVGQQAQFIIATHSPIIMAYPDALIYEITDESFKKVKYEETENYVVMKSFLNNTEKMLDILMNEKE
ncbi:AAA family ATPase [Geosporobacter ferrireducens]|uniref:AAA family ATPase n=2 Tax=Geosporobacter ferrireducens TaxID=1424294 RepID=A0A1D8GKM7_9FIRM|nr:AAA family ATPase [Geosporobacter ferrireducens]AOT71460.1 AAA family ATPase [Geosporobacter ferrireducens]MTI57768.1 ATP-binding cassette domain-containing protein [Geosporobacter ferrireducens]